MQLGQPTSQLGVHEKGPANARQAQTPGTLTHEKMWQASLHEAASKQRTLEATAEGSTFHLWLWVGAEAAPAPAPAAAPAAPPAGFCCAAAAAATAAERVSSSLMHATAEEVGKAGGSRRVYRLGSAGWRDAALSGTGK